MVTGRSLMSSLTLSSGDMMSMTVNADLDCIALSTPVQFVGGVDARYTCVSCSAALRKPVQTQCGHRLCAPCLDALCVTGTPVRCPGNDNDCVDLTRNSICPDFSAMREMKMLAVQCINSCRGCKEEPLYGKLKEHLDTCKFNLATCSHCCAQIAAPELDKHVKSECRQAPATCHYSCDVGTLPRFKMAEHEQQCPRRPHRCRFNSVGCTFQAPKSELVEHESDAKTHLVLTLEYILSHDRESGKISEKQQSMEADLATVKAQLSSNRDESVQLRSAVRSLTAELLSLKSTLSSQSQIIANLTSKLVAYESSNERQSDELRQMKDRQQDLINSVRELAARPAAAGTALPEELRKQMITYDRTVGLHDVRLSDLDLRCQCLETANYDGVLVWKISDYMERKRQAIEGRILSLYSQPFYTSRYGYKLCARVYLNGDGSGRNTHMSLFFVVMQGDYDELLSWPFRQRVSLSLLDQRHNRRHMQDSFRPDPTSASFQKPQTPMNVASGCPTFVPHATLEDTDGPYLVNNVIFIRVAVDTNDLLNP